MPAAVRSRSRLLLAPAAPAGPSAPTAAYTLGTEVGVPTGTSLTSRSSLGADDGSETYDLVHPVTAATASPTVTVWRHKRFTSRIDVNPGSGVTYLFDECSFEGTNDFWCFDQGAGDSTSQLLPRVIFRRCQFDGGDAVDRVLSGHRMWLDSCQITGGADGWQGCAFSVMIDSNVIATTDSRNPDPHSDGIQFTDTGDATFYRSWLSGGSFPGTNAAARLGTEFGAIDGVGFYYCGLERGGYTLQVRGDAGAGDITDTTVIGCKFAPNFGYGTHDFVEATGTTWTDNTMLDGTPISL